MSRIPALTGALIAVAALSGCASSPAPSAAGGPAAAPSSPSCMSQYLTWRSGGGVTKLVAVINDMNAASKDARALGRDVAAGDTYTKAESALQSEAAAISADSQASQDDPAPACVPRFDADQSAAMDDASRAAVDCDNVVQALNAGDDALVTSDSAASAKVSDAADARFKAIAADLKAFEDSD